MSESATAVSASCRCPCCAAAFECGAGTAGVGDPFDCWCAALPPLAAPGAGRWPAGRCLCPACLTCLSAALAHGAARGGKPADGGAIGPTE